MKVYDTADIRNVALVGHGGSGKTSLASAFLWVSGAVNRLGKVDDGTAITDFDDEEISRKISLQAALAHLEWKGKKVNLLDTPGYAAFIADAKAALSVADAALLLVEGVAGVQVVTPRVFGYAEERSLPVIFVINKLDRERSSFERCLEEIQGRFGRTAIPLQLPVGREGDFRAVVDLLTLKLHRYGNDDQGKVAVEDVPADLAAAAQQARSALVEMIAESDETLMEKYFEAGELTHDQLTSGLAAALRQRKVFPVLCSSATQLVGTRSILDHIVQLCPDPAWRGEVRGTHPDSDAEVTRPVSSTAPISMFVFKTVADPFAGRISLFRVCSGTARGDSSVINIRTGTAERLGHPSLMQGKQIEAVGELPAGDLGVVTKLKETQTNDTLADPAHRIRFPAIVFPEPSIAYAVEPKSKGDEEKISTALARLLEEDPVLRVGRDPRTHELLVSGASDVHVEVAITKMKKKFGVEAVLRQPKVAYLETITRRVENIEGKHKKQTGGRGQFAVCVIHMEPLERGAGFKFADKIFGGSIPENYRPAVEKGVIESAARGVLAGCPVIDFQVTLIDGKYHDVDSSEMAFKIAGSLAFKEAVRAARPVLLEPIMHVEITAPEEYMGEIMGNLSSRRGKPQGMESHGGDQVIKADVPMSEMLTYASTLKSITSDRGTYHMEFHHYEQVPAQVQEHIVAEAAKARQHEE